MTKRKSMRGLKVFRNRYWKRTPGGSICDNCGKLICGFMTPIKNKKTLRVLCPDCYEAGK